MHELNTADEGKFLAAANEPCTRTKERTNRPAYEQNKEPNLGSKPEQKKTSVLMAPNWTTLSTRNITSGCKSDQAEVENSIDKTQCQRKSGWGAARAAAAKKISGQTWNAENQQA
jgi:hypothetical protein